MKRRRVDSSADGLALMTSSVTSSYSADGLTDQSQESAAIAKRCRLHKLIRQRFALALKIQQEDFALIISAVASYSGSSHGPGSNPRGPKISKFQNRPKRARYRIPARKLHGLPGTGPNQTLEEFSRHYIVGEGATGGGGTRNFRMAAARRAAARKERRSAHIGRPAVTHFIRHRRQPAPSKLRPRSPPRATSARYPRVKRRQASPNFVQPSAASALVLACGVLVPVFEGNLVAADLK
ncbi:hypothetical protein F511_08701 [Dorcoceras hygrometricum]|uniref:Uncharacterized protein n=1 Tax=Dorcoceras hygrometricum TaxID=472368 RepID=A0A2Z7D2U9_9LAMI|nr:hypothetical protein F511_08701 [Dorcoceras hygrometricum]